MKAFQTFAVRSVVQPAVREHAVHISDDQTDALQLFQSRRPAALPGHRAYPFQILRRVHASAHERHFQHTNGNTGLKKAELFQLFRLFQRRGRQGGKTAQGIGSVGIDADMPQKDGGFCRLADKGKRRAAEIQRVSRMVADHLDLMGGTGLFLADTAAQCRHLNAFVLREDGEQRFNG